ncbi:MAG TPA: hypothetical protein DEB15_15560 [Pusillimonas sp.]|nr:hypothetical protein [Pusillimonas sp.]HCN71005.1 hypothetical protein [Pusillimonas sp.]
MSPLIACIQHATISALIIGTCLAKKDARISSWHRVSWLEAVEFEAGQNVKRVCMKIIQTLFNS